MKYILCFESGADRRHDGRFFGLFFMVTAGSEEGKTYDKNGIICFHESVQFGNIGGEIGVPDCQVLAAIPHQILAGTPERNDQVMKGCSPMVFRGVE